MSEQPEDYLQLSGIQHFMFCRRQWAMIHIEQQWQENLRTFEGRELHNRVDDPFFSENRKGLIITRSLPVFSHYLRLQGVCDVVEFIASDEGVKLPSENGYFKPYPVEYKRGKEKNDEVDMVQVCAQAICLEEMLATSIPEGAIFYGATRRRQRVQFTDDLRKKVKKLTDEMYDYFERGFTPKAKYTSSCEACSLIGICLPKVTNSGLTVKDYIDQNINISL